MTIRTYPLGKNSVIIFLEEKVEIYRARRQEGEKGAMWWEGDFEDFAYEGSIRQVREVDD